MSEEQKSSDVPSDWAQVKIKEQENWGKLLDNVGPAIEVWKTQVEKQDAPVAKATVWGIILLTVAVIGSTTGLMYADKLTESAFTFIIGTLFGMLITMAKGFFGGGE
ncbi:MAG: hypothetical protein H6596_02360 [Flavobacteriales bacterium]|nr:hypothetical protein [Flavobacteriales bacterium]